MGADIFPTHNKHTRLQLGHALLWYSCSGQILLLPCAQRNGGRSSSVRVRWGLPRAMEGNMAASAPNANSSKNIIMMKPTIMSSDTKGSLCCSPRVLWMAACMSCAETRAGSSRLTCTRGIFYVPCDVARAQQGHRSVRYEGLKKK